jgi:hypothetical protein
MSHKEGAYLGGIRSVEDLRQRCRIDGDTGCWHWSLAVVQGHPKVHLKLNGKRSAHRGRKASLLLAGKTITPGHVVFAARNCLSDDCVNPEHARSSTRANHGQYMKFSGKAKSPAKSAAAVAMARKHLAKLDWGKVREIRASSLTTYQLAEKYGVSQYCIWAVTSGKSWQETARQSSVFTFRPQQMKEAA